MNDLVTSQTSQTLSIDPVVSINDVFSSDQIERNIFFLNFRESEQPTGKQVTLRLDSTPISPNSGIMQLILDK